MVDTLSFSSTVVFAASLVSPEFGDKHALELIFNPVSINQYL